MNSLVCLVLEAMSKTVENDDIVFLTFRELKEQVNKVPGGEKMRNKDLREVIGVLKANGRLNARKIGGREIYYLTKVVKIFKTFLRKEREKEQVT